jgi:anti-repressor protein
MTSTQLIPINQTKFDNQIKQTINARDLHSFLQVKTKFADWIKERILKYDFRESLDFVASEKTEGLNTAQNRVDYFLTLEMAKELSMVENNEKGREARKYFIKKEKEANVRQPALPTTYKEALKSLLEQVEKNEELALENEKKTIMIENYIKQEKDIAMTDFAKKHNLHPNKFIEKLRILGYLYRKDNVNIPYTAELKKHFVAKYTKDINGKTRNNYYLTSKGCQHFIERLERGDFEDIKTN